MCKIIQGLILLVCCVSLSRNASLSSQDLKKYKQLIEGQGLYSVDDDVVILTADNFKESIYGRNRSILVEFYNSWCGYCQRFAPSWKALANEVKGWKSLVAIAALDCNNEDNAPICRDFEIMAYPTLRYFHENYEEKQGNIGTAAAKGDDVYSHKRYLINQMIQEQKEGRGKQFPNILPYTSEDDKDLFEGASIRVSYSVLIFEDSESLTGPEIALDLYQVPDVIVRYSYANNTALIKSIGASTLPAIYIKGKDESSTLITEFIKTRDDVKKAVKEILNSKSINIPQITTKKNIYTGKWLDAEVPDISDLMEEIEKEKLRDKIKKMGDVVFQSDLETALRYSLKREVALYKIISGEKLEALIKYLKVLAKYFPFGKNGQTFLADIKDKVLNSYGGTVSGADIAQWVTDAEEPDKRIFSSKPQWMRCLGSASKFRGYPCGLWTLFHFLTVAAAEQNLNNEDAYPREILDAMQGYIKNFFGCHGCAEHFQQMVLDNELKSVSSLDSSVLWLWMTHNDVNKRLHGDATEDPEYPKIQYPSAENCPNCRSSDDKWVYEEVLHYLKHVYSGINVRYIGADTRILHEGLEGSVTNSGSSTVFFRKIDASMCFILYVGSFFLIVILIRMFLKRGYKKKMYVHDLLGKV